MKILQRILPSIYGFSALFLMLLLHYFLPVIDMIDPPWSFLGYLFMLSGMSLVLGCVLLLNTEKTTIMPLERPSKLVTHGLYRYSRNPIYLGMVMVVLGIAVALGSLTAFLVVPVYFFIIQEGFIKYEEKSLEELFGDEFRRYRNKVRRWI